MAFGCASRVLKYWKTGPSPVRQTQKILLAGYAVVNGQQDLALWRFNLDGTLDTSFGNGGEDIVVFPGAAPIGQSQANALAVDPVTGDIVVGGEVLTATGGVHTELVVAVFHADGTPDSQFGHSGMSLGPAGTVTTNFTAGWAQIKSRPAPPTTARPASSPWPAISPAASSTPASAAPATASVQPAP